MLTTSKVLTELALKYIAASNRSEGEYRLIMPGPTSTIGEELHSALRDSGINSFLVIGSSRRPNEDRRWLLPVSLTSMRIGSFAAICDPGALADVRDSIRGSGGAIRSCAFSEEWPWIDDGSESFQFSGPFIATLLDQWNIGEEDRTWFRKLIACVLVGSTRRMRDRAMLLLEDILGRFSPSDAEALPSIRDRFLFHCGIPDPGDTNVEPNRLALLVRRRLIKPIFERVRSEADVREQVRANISNDDPIRDRLIVAIERFFDGLAGAAIADADILSFRECWGTGSEGIENWQALTLDRLCSLFEIQEQAPVNLTVRFDDMSDSLVSSDRLMAASSAGQEAALRIEYALPSEEHSSATCRLQLAIRNRTIFDQVLTDASASLTEAIPSLDSLNLSYRSRVSIRAAIVIDDEVRAEARVYLHCYGETRKAFVVTTPHFWVDDARDISEDDPGPEQRHTVDGPVRMHIFSHSSEQPSVTCDDVEEQLVEANGFWSTAESLDVFGEASGQLTCRCDVGHHWVSISYEAEDIERGEFTLEDELRRSIVHSAEDRVNEILAIFAGTSRTPYPRLGQLTVRTRQLARMAACYENQHGWQPLLLDLHGGLAGAIKACGDYCRTWGDIRAIEAIAATRLPDQPLELLREYSQARDSVRETILGLLDMGTRPSEHPEYAVYPVYLLPSAEHGESLEAAVVHYLHAYRSILSYQDKHLTGLSWEQAFTLTYLDCAVHWGTDAAKNNAFLLGPWHPLVIAKRFMVQRALVLRGQRLTDKKDRNFARLVNLLSAVTGFRWHPCLKAEDVAIEAAHVVPTSDPGWHLAFKRRAVDGGKMLGLLTEGLHENFGIEASISVPTSGAMVGTVMQSFLRTFPSKRHVGIYLPKGFQGHQETTSIDQLLHHGDEPTSAGHQLTGGVALCFQETPELSADTSWANPPLQIFQYPDWESCVSERYPDIRFCQPESGPRFLEVDDLVTLPRGRGSAAVFSRPLSRCIQGQAFIPKSVTEGWDSADFIGEGVGAAFVGACGLASQIPKQSFGVVESVALPERLETYWTVVPGTVLDPAVFIRYVKDGRDRNIEERALWDYHISLSSGTSSFFVLSTIPASYRSAVNGVFEDGEDHASAFVSELGRVGLAIAGEAMKSGRHALGTIGLVGAVRLFSGDDRYLGPIKWTENHIGFLLPVDSFEEFFGNKADRARGEFMTSRRRADLLAVSVSFPRDRTQPLTIQAVAVECKYSSGTYPSANVYDALGQAQVTAEWFKSLCKLAQLEGGMVERLGLLQMVWFGTRISGDGCDRRMELEQHLYEAILSGHFQFKPAKRPAVLVSTEAGLTGPAEMSFSQSGAWIRLNRQHWPGICDTSSIEAIRSAVTDLFDVAPQTDNVSHGEVECEEDMPSATNRPSPETAPSKERESDSPQAQESREAMGKHGHAPSRPELDSSGQRESPEKGPVKVAPSTPESLGVPVRRLLVGVDSARREVYFDPHSPVDRLDNVNAMITGSSGKGKTQLLKYLLTALRDQGANAIILDFKNDFASDAHFVERASLEAVLIAFDGVPFNPIIPYPVADPRSDKLFIQPAQHITGVASVFRRTYGLGPQQEAAVKNAIRQAFSEAGVDPASTTPYDPNVTFPDLARVGEILEQNNPNAYNRLDPLFTLGLFKEQFSRTSFARMVTRSTVMDLSQIPSDPLKDALAELIVLSAHSYFNSQPHVGALRQVFAVDEAHRILEANFLERFAKECRAYGVSLLLSSQYPSDFPAGISACMATKIVHGNDRDVSRVRDIVNLLGCAGREAEIADLGMFDAMFSNKHFRDVCIRTITYPIELVLSALQQSESGELSREEIANTPGVDTAKLSVGNIVRHLERLGIAEGTNGCIRLVSRNT